MFGSRLLSRGALALAILLPATLVADDAAEDSKPVLISTTGGKGSRWSTIDELKKAAEAHDPKACAQFGDALLRGDEVKQDTALAMKFLREAAAANEPNAAFRLGKIYDDGEHAPQDFAKAFEFYSAAAKGGVPEAQYNLGVLYVSARGTKRDFVEGLAWLIVATKNGAKGDGEQKTREQIAKLKRPRYIADAERRAAEILKDPVAAAADVTPTIPKAPAKTVAPAKVSVGAEPAGPAKTKIAPAIAPLPSMSPGLGVPPTPPRLEPPPAAPENKTGADETPLSAPAAK